MNTYVAISEENKIYSWLPDPNEQYSQPPDNAICWVTADNDDGLLSEAKDKFSKLGFEILSVDFYSPAPGADNRAIHLVVKERTDTSSIEIGESKLSRLDMTKGWIAH